MNDSFSSGKMQRMFDRLSSLLVGAGVPRTAALAALDDAYTKHEKRLEREVDSDQLTRIDKILMGNLLSLWAQLPLYCDDEGSPRSIPECGEAPSFEDLRNRTIKITPEAQNAPSTSVMLQRFLERGAIALDGKDCYRRLLDFFPTSTTQRANVALLLDYLDDYLHTTEHNTRHGGGTGHFQRVAQASGFPSRKLPMINQLTHEAGMEFLRTVDAAIMNFIENAAEASLDTKTNVGVGVYLYARDGDD